MKSNFLNIYRSVTLISIASATAIDAAAQSSNPSGGESAWFLIVLIGLALIGVATYLWFRRSAVPPSASQYDFGNRHNQTSNSFDDGESVDAEKELEWFRTMKKPLDAGKFKRRMPNPETGTDSRPSTTNGLLDTRAFLEKMRKNQYAQLPINSFIQLSEARVFDRLPLSSDPALINAIEQAQEEYEEDEAVRELAVRVLAAFRNRNSVEALSQIALYDLSANIRSKAVTVLTGFDHESVFEAILLACADPTREVRAAASHGLFRLSFDRAEAWKRIISTREEFRMRHAARAAIESGIAGQSLERLLHDDMKVAYEAFVLVALLIKSGESESIFEALVESKDGRIKFALLHVLSIVKDVRANNRLLEIQRKHDLPQEIKDKIKEVTANFEAVAA